ncbi:MAG: dienelactone hydrolase family protein [Anaerolineae bacterium]|nr:dienelactone hydrolase family protein [Anaerolineae bacterium]
MRNVTRSVMQRLVVLVVLVGLMLPGLASTGAVQGQEAETLPYAAHGPYPVGTREVVIDASGESPLEATLWYPALNPDGAAEQVLYQYGLLALPGAAIQDAAPDAAGGPYPVVIFAHGFGGLRYQSLFLTEHLASWGVVVLAADFPGSNLATALTDPAAMAAGVVEGFATRPPDMLRQITYLDALPADDPLSGLLDMERLAVMGHSFGGYTALATAGAQLDLDALAAWCDEPVAFDWPEDALSPTPHTVRARSAEGRELRTTACFVLDQAGRLAELRGLDEIPTGPWPATTDPRLDAVVALAPWNVPALGEAGMASLSVPQLVMVGSADAITPPARDAFAAFDWANSPVNLLVEFDGAGHGLFTDLCDNPLVRALRSDLCGGDENSPFQRQQTQHVVTAFLLRAFTDAPVLDPWPDFSDVAALDGVRMVGASG